MTYFFTGRKPDNTVSLATLLWMGETSELKLQNTTGI